VLRCLEELSPAHAFVASVEAHLGDNCIFAQGELSAQFAATALAIINFIFAKFANFFV
jgi:hypothetical protein